MSKLQLHNFLSLYMYQSQNLIKKTPKTGETNSNGFDPYFIHCVLFFLLCFS